MKIFEKQMSPSTQKSWTPVFWKSYSVLWCSNYSICTSVGKHGLNALSSHTKTLEMRFTASLVYDAQNEGDCVMKKPTSSFVVSFFHFCETDRC